MSDSTQAAERLKIAFELVEFAERAVRLRFRRNCPEGSLREEEDFVSAWLRARPGAEQGDADGQPREIKVRQPD